MTSATPAKLQNGTWGARVQSNDVRIGDDVKITTRAGKSWTATVGRVVWSGNGVTLVTTEARSTQRVERRTYSHTSCGYPCPVTGRRCTPSDPCHDCQ